MYQKIQNKIVEFLAHDKCLHFMFGLIVFVLSALFVQDEIALGITFLVALLKEIRDHVKYKGFDIADIIFTVIPAVILIVFR